MYFLLELAGVDISAIFECMAHVVVYFKSSCAADVANSNDKT